ncbi:putative transposase [Bosea sp. OAE752]
MKRSRFSDEQIIGILSEHEAGIPVAELCRSTVSAMAAPSSGKLRLKACKCPKLCGCGRSKNAKLKRILADATLDNVALKDLLGKKW